ncbi:YafY family protein [Lipingzhangella sp. LS1_29]|uniref:YafY family protein n=1 Tax=Lipingzhangella rawalii TaxID=2055835 RepID=A0ABU2HAJ8_9ACTN|nr:YafY family protein [Lipingzhangella rawalii]MDS1271875.1 YafY family protein [Lipingzhangella rawalii]
MRSERLVALMFTLQNRRRATVAELAAELEVSPRTVHRDLAALHAVGVPLWSESGRHGGVGLVEGWRTRLDGLSAREAVTLLSMTAPQELAHLGLGSAVTAAQAKLTAALPASLRDQAQRLARRFHLDAPGWFRDGDDTEQLAPVARAVWEQRRLRITYRRGDGTVLRRVDPLGLVLKAGIWYLAARVLGEDTSKDPSARPVRTYRVGRILATEELGVGFPHPADFDLATWWATSAAHFERSIWRGTVRLRLSPAGTRLLARIMEAESATWALEQAPDPEADGWVEVRVPMQDPEITAHQLLALGPDVEVVEPPEVRARFVEYASRMLDRHR